MNELTFNILKIIVSICAAIITVYVVPYIKTLKNDKHNENLFNMVDLAVKAAEQTIGSGQGAFKKSEVTAFVSKWMNENGIKISDDELSQLIEAAVWQMKQNEGK